MKLTLAFAPGACAVVPYILLTEAGADFQTRPVNLAKGENFSPEYLKVNPKGKVPALIVDGTVITENVAIHVWIDRQFPQAQLMPRDPMTYIQCLSFLGWCGSGIHPKLTQQARPERYCDLPGATDRVKQLGHEGMVEQYELAEELLEGKTWFFDNRRGAAFGNDLSRFKNCLAHRQRMEQRASVKALLAHEDQVKAEFAKSA